MKRIHILFYLIATLMSCNKSNETSQTQDLLIGQWKLTSFVNELSGTSINASDPNYYDPIDNTEVLISINFNENFDFDGSTSRNSFNNTYRLNESEKVLIFKDISTTEVGETDFGNLFFDNLQLNYNQQTQNIESNFEISNTILKLYYSENEYIEFERM